MKAKKRDELIAEACVMLGTSGLGKDVTPFATALMLYGYFRGAGYPREAATKKARSVLDAMKEEHTA